MDCGSGGNQWGENNHRFKTGVGKPYYRRVCFTYHDPKCIHCGFVTLHPKFFWYMCHHVDHNRYNNEADNLVPVCKHVIKTLNTSRGAWMDDITECRSKIAGIKRERLEVANPNRRHGVKSVSGAERRLWTRFTEYNQPKSPRRWYAI